MSRLVWGLVAVSIALFIFVQSSSAAPSVGGPAVDDALSYFAHLLLYGALAFSTMRAVAASTSRSMLLVVLFVSAYGATDELHQYFVPTREASVLDLVVDVVGAFAGAALARHGLSSPIGGSTGVNDTLERHD